MTHKGRPADDRKEQQGKEAQQRQEPHIIEWVVGGISAGIVVVMIGFTLFQALSTSGLKPDLLITVEQVEQVSEGFHVAFRALNRGSGTAAAVKIEGLLKTGEQVIESSEVTLDYVPARSESKGGLLFDRDPNQHQLTLKAKSYQRP